MTQLTLRTGNSFRLQVQCLGSFLEQENVGMKEFNISLKMIEAGIKCIFGEQLKNSV